MRQCTTERRTKIAQKEALPAENFYFVGKDVVTELAEGGQSMYYRLTTSLVIDPFATPVTRRR